MIDAKTCINDAQEKMDMAVMYLEEALAHIRAGKASTRLLDGIRVDSYGSMVPISNVCLLYTSTRKCRCMDHLSCYRQRDSQSVPSLSSYPLSLIHI